MTGRYHTSTERLNHASPELCCTAGVLAMLADFAGSTVDVHRCLGFGLITRPVV